MLYIHHEIARQAFPELDDWRLMYIARAIDNLAANYIKQGLEPIIDHREVCSALKHFNMDVEGSDIRAALVQTVEARAFKCKWVLPIFQADFPGYELVRGKQPLA